MSRTGGGSNVTESELANAIMAQGASSGGWEVEIHYNYYGQRGVVDLAVGLGQFGTGLMELKSEAAVRNATGANEIIRQFNRMREYFYKGTDYENEGTCYELVFTATDYNLRHLHENAEMYSSVSRKPNSDEPGNGIGVISVYSVEDGAFLYLFDEWGDYRDLPGSQTFGDYCVFHAPEMTERLRPTIDFIHQDVESS